MHSTSTTIPFLIPVITCCLNSGGGAAIYREHEGGEAMREHSFGYEVGYAVFMWAIIAALLLWVRPRLKEYGRIVWALAILIGMAWAMEVAEQLGGQGIFGLLDRGLNAIFKMNRLGNYCDAKNSTFAD